MKITTFCQWRAKLGLLTVVLRLCGVWADDVIHSVAEGANRTAVTTTRGIFEAPKTGGRWTPIHHPGSMPLPGVVVGNPDPEGALYHYAVRAYRPAAQPGDPAVALPVRPEWLYGLYSRKSTGAGWERISDDLGFIHLLVLKDRLVAVTRRPDRPGEGERILESYDGGVGWKPLAEFPSQLGAVQRLLQDPEFPDRPAAFLVGLRGYFVRLAGDPPQWKAKESHRLAATIRSRIGLETEGWSWAGVPSTSLRLSNYFDLHPRTGVGASPIPTAWIGTESRYEFEAGKEVRIVVRLRIGQDFPTQTGRRFVDSAVPGKAWGFRRWTPSGALEEYPPLGLSEDPIDRRALEPCKSDSGPGISLLLSSRAAFAEPGRHRVQIVYDTVTPSKRRPKEWAVRLLSEPFDIEVR